MRIALDARVVYAPHRRGIGRSLLRLYGELAAVRPDWRVLALHRGSDKDRRWEPLAPQPLWSMPAGFWQRKAVEMPGDRFDAWNRYRLPAEAARRGADVLHCPANACPWSTRVPMIVTVHDLIPLDHHDGQTPAEKRRFEGWMRNAVRHAAAILCVSQHTADALSQRFDVAPERLTVCPHGIDSVPEPSEADLARVRERYPMDRPFVLHFGAAAPRKNTTRTLEAWSKIGDQLRNTHRLLVVGLDPATRQRLSLNLSNMGLSESVTLCEFAPAEDLPMLMREARALAFVSRAEGFGLPLLEAFAAGTPAVTGDRTSLPEVAGDAAVMVDPKNGDAIARALRKVLTDEALRTRLIEAGHRRCELYTWRAAAERFASVVEQAASRRPHTRRCCAA